MHRARCFLIAVAGGAATLPSMKKATVRWDRGFLILS